MSVGVQRKPCRKMPQHTRHGLDVHTVCSASVAKVWRRSWKRTFGNPAHFRTRCSMCNTLSGDMGPPVGDVNTHSLLPVFLLCCIRTLIASADSGKVR